MIICYKLRVGREGGTETGGGGGSLLTFRQRFFLLQVLSHGKLHNINPILCRNCTHKVSLSSHSHIHTHTFTNTHSAILQQLTIRVYSTRHGPVLRIPDGLDNRRRFGVLLLLQNIENLLDHGLFSCKTGDPPLVEHASRVDGHPHRFFSKLHTRTVRISTQNPFFPRSPAQRETK